MHIQELATSALAFSLTLSSARADVLNVGGPEADFAEILPAVQAAADGDVIRIWPGQYGSFAVLDKDLTLVPAIDGGAVQVNGMIRIQNLSAGKTVELAGIDCEGSDGPGMLIAECLGSVRIREALVEGVDGEAGPPWVAYYGLRVVDCADVELVGSTVLAGETSGFDLTQFGAEGIWSESSRLSLFDCRVEGGHGSTEDDPGESGGWGGAAILAWGADSSLYVSGCTLVGGNGSPADPGQSLATGQYGCGGSGGNGVHDHAIVETVLHDCDVQPGLGAWGPQNCSGSEGLETYFGTYRPGPSRLLDSSDWVHDTEPIQLDLKGAPGAGIWLGISLDAGLVFDSVKGPLLIEASAPFNAQPWRFLGSLDGSGSLSTTLRAPDLQPGMHATWHLQALISGASTRRSSSAWTVVVGT